MSASTKYLPLAVILFGELRKSFAPPRTTFTESWGGLLLLGQINYLAVYSTAHSPKLSIPAPSILSLAAQRVMVPR